MRYEYLPEQLPIGIDAMYAIGGTRPQVAILINAQSIRIPRFYLVKDLAALQRSVRANVKGADVLFGSVARLIAGFGDIKSRLIRREGKPVGTVEVICRDTDRAAFRIEAVERGRLLRYLAPAFVVVLNPI